MGNRFSMKQPANPSIHAKRARVIAMTVPLVGKLLASFHDIRINLIYLLQMIVKCEYYLLSLSKLTPGNVGIQIDGDEWVWVKQFCRLLYLQKIQLCSWYWPVLYLVADLFSDSLILQDVIEGHQETAVNHDWHKFNTSCLYVWNVSDIQWNFLNSSEKVQAQSRLLFNFMYGASDIMGKLSLLSSGNFCFVLYFLAWVICWATNNDFSNLRKTRSVPWSTRDWMKKSSPDWNLHRVNNYPALALA